MNEKNKRKRQNVSLDRKAHRRFKMLSVRGGKTLEELIDDAAFMYLKINANPLRYLMRGTGE